MGSLDKELLPVKKRNDKTGGGGKTAKSCFGGYNATLADFLQAQNNAGRHIIKAGFLFAPDGFCQQ